MEYPILCQIKISVLINLITNVLVFCGLFVIPKKEPGNLSLYILDMIGSVAFKNLIKIIKKKIDKNGGDFLGH